MSKPVSQQKLLWHLTALDNLESILKNGLLARSRTRNFVDVADSEIIEKRIELGLVDYVPFHFFQGNPFDGSTLKANSDEKFCYIVIYRDLARKKDYKILPQHPVASGNHKLYDYDKGLEVIDWELVDKRNYVDQECKIACMAECLAPGYVKPEDFQSIKVRTEEDKLYVERISKSVLDNYKYFIDVDPYCFNAQGGDND